MNGKINIGEMLFTETGENAYVYYDKDGSRINAVKFNPLKEEIPFMDKLDTCYFVKYNNENLMLLGYDKQLNEYFAPIVKF